MSRPVATIILLVVVHQFVFQSTALAQSGAGSIRGIVVDRDAGLPIRRVAVRLQSTGETVVTDEDGRFQLTNVTPGDQELYVSAVDFILVKRTITVVAGVPV